MNTQNTNAKPKGLLLKTISVVVVAGSLTVFAYLPAEHGIDPTGVGKMLGLTKMGDIKKQLLAEAAADAASHSVNEHRHSDGTIHSHGDGHDDHAGHNHERPRVEVPVIKSGESNQGPASTLVKSEGTDGYQDKLEYTLKPDEAIEVKLAMDKDAVAEFMWTANGGALNFNTHGDASGKNITYDKGTNKPEQTGTLKAAFSGAHGWFWRNRTEETVVVTLQTRGDYFSLILR